MQKDEFYHMHKMWSRHTNLKMTYVRRYTWDTDSWTLATEWCRLGVQFCNEATPLGLLEFQLPHIRALQ